MLLSIHQNTSALKRAFAISRGAKTEAKTVLVELNNAHHKGRGECVPYARYGETVASVMAEIDSFRGKIEAGLSRADLQNMMPAGAARCAVDCAMWDLEAKTSGQPVWKLAGLPAPTLVETAVTVSLDTPENMAAAARQISGKLLKLKLGGESDIARLDAVHNARPDARLIIDGNEGLVPADFPDFAQRAAGLGVFLIEQPFPAGDDGPLDHLADKTNICADESAHTSHDIPALSKRYGAVNIKLDKAGGLTEALKMVAAARAANMRVMIGCMVAGSLSMAPSVLLAGLCDVADLDGPLWLAEDIEHGLSYQNGYVAPPAAALWG